MVWELNDSKKVYLKITGWKDFEDLKETINELVAKKLWREVSVTKQHYPGWYASKWYISTKTNCLWEIDYPDFPAEGFVRNFPDNIYTTSDEDMINKRRGRL